MTRIWRTFLAMFRLSESAVCEMSVGRGPHEDYHDYPDSTSPFPDHFVEHTCRRCAKTFFV